MASGDLCWCYGLSAFSQIHMLKPDLQGDEGCLGHQVSKTNSLIKEARENPPLFDI